MREIKFRAWDKDRKLMLPFENLYLTNTGGFRIPENYRMEAETTLESVGGYNHDDFQVGMGEDEYTLMQYTGLKDKNGKEIYEGDIVSLRENRLVISWESRQVGINGWEYGGGYTGFVAREHGSEDDEICGIAQTFVSSNYGDSHLYADDMEVIGNIYENSDLLGE